MKSLIVANWKMNPTTGREAKKLVDETKHLVGLMKQLSVVIAPPSVFLRELAAGRSGGRVAFAGQNAHFEERGSYTGEISVAQLKDVKARYVILGHAERRAMGETDELIQRKVTAALSAGLIPILCVGETTRGKDAEHFTIVREQVRIALTGVEQKIGKIIIAYEPIWAIGSNAAMRPHDMHEMSIFIRKTIVEKCGAAGHNVKILYGGSVDATNAGVMMRDGDVAGLLVGRASIDVQAFGDLLRAVHEA